MKNEDKVILKGLGLRKGVMQQIRYHGKVRNIEVLGVKKGRNGLLLQTKQYKKCNKSFKGGGVFRYFKIEKMEVIN